METKTEWIDGCLVVVCQQPALDIKSAELFIEEMAEARAVGAQTIVDMSKVEFVDSAGLGAIVATLKRIRSNGGEMRMCCVANTVRALFELVRLQQLVEVHSSREEALQAALTGASRSPA